jgi:PAS domain S-box-containing protein
VDPAGRFLEVNDRMCQIVGRSAKELLVLSCQELSHDEDWPATACLMKELVAGERAEFAIEKRYRRGDGSSVWVNVSVSPLSDERGVVQRLVSVVEDISARKQAEEEIKRHREHLEQLVRERTAALETSHERLRLADRLASVGTLAAGLGHDMGNLLLPVRMRLDALERMELPQEAREDVAAIADACEYLKRLSHGLRLFALNPEDDRAAGDHTHPGTWWMDVSTFMRNALSRTIELRHSVPERLPAIAIAPQLLTQSVYNLVQNAGDALKGRAGRVEVSAALSDDKQSVVIQVMDDGPGMSPEVLQRCTEPFFTTKTRGISTGLGLALVHGAARKAGGAFEIRSSPGRGTTCRLVIPVYTEPAARELKGRLTARVQIREPRMRAFVDSVLSSLNVSVAPDHMNGDARPGLLVADTLDQSIRDFLAASPLHRAVVFGDGGSAIESDQAVFLEAHPPAVRVRSVLRNIVNAGRPEVQEAAT